MRGVHGEKIAALLDSSKLPDEDRPRVKKALSLYANWVKEINTVKATSLDELIIRLVDALNRYKFYIDVNLIFDSRKDFLYRQKGQLKLDNTVIEEFMPVFVRRCIDFELGIAGGLSIKTKDYDFSVSRKI